jgi:hypothetical protein
MLRLILPAVRNKVESFSLKIVRTIGGGRVPKTNEVLS